MKKRIIDFFMVPPRCLEKILEKIPAYRKWIIRRAVKALREELMK